MEFIYIPKHIFAVADLKPTEAVIYGIVLGYTKSPRGCYNLCVDELADELNISPPTVRRTVLSLEKKQVLITERRGKKIILRAVVNENTENVKFKIYESVKIITTNNKNKPDESDQIDHETRQIDHETRQIDNIENDECCQIDHETRQIDHETRQIDNIENYECDQFEKKCDQFDHLHNIQIIANNRGESAHPPAPAPPAQHARMSEAKAEMLKKEEKKEKKETPPRPQPAEWEYVIEAIQNFFEKKIGRPYFSNFRNVTDNARDICAKVRQAVRFSRFEGTESEWFERFLDLAYQSADPWQRNHFDLDTINSQFNTFLNQINNNSNGRQQASITQTDARRGQSVSDDYIRRVALDLAGSTAD